MGRIDSTIPERSGSPTLLPVRILAQGSDASPASGMVSNGRRSLILEADDLGLLYAFNEGIRAAYHEGLLTSTCLRANGYAYEHAIQDVLPACPDLGVGVHLCLNEAEPVAERERVPLLLDDCGSLRRGFVWLMKVSRTAAGLQQIEIEFRAQLARVLGDGLRPDHLNSHQHVHMIPAIFRLTCRLAREYGIPCVRLVRELPYGAGGLRKHVQPYVNSNFAKRVLLNRLARVNEAAAHKFGIPTTDYFVGVNYTSDMSLRPVVSGLQAAPYGSVELLLHPAIGPDRRDVRYPTPSLYKYVTARQRGMELRSLRSPKLSDFLQREGWKPMTFATWARARQPSAMPRSTPVVPEDARQLCETVEVTCPPWVSEAQDDSRVFAQLVLTQTQPGLRVLDLGTGTGILAICLAQAGRSVAAVDISAAAVRTARANAAHSGVSFECYESDLLGSVQGRFDLIAFNPPYAFRRDNFVTSVAKHVLRRVPWIRQHSGLAMPRTVLKYHQQLIAQLMAQAPDHLAPGGAVLLHAYESEVGALTHVLPDGATVELLQHPQLTINRTVGMLVRFPATGIPQ
jgi:chitin disaccharide deacetylase